MIAALVGFALALAESGLGLGAVVPGEMAISALAAVADGPRGALALGGAVALGATAGDHLGYAIGRRGGSRIRGSRLVARLGVDRWDRAADVVQRFGFWAMLASRLLPVVRTVMPVVAGSAELRYRAFLPASLIGAVAWSTLWVGAGSGIATSGVLDHPEMMLAAAAVGLTGLLGRRLARRRRTARTAVPAISSTSQQRRSADDICHRRSMSCASQVVTARTTGEGA
ncbi:DedA family protein [Aeromicrobium stalagmiti]|uniref:DedA family protein n=1 Tax=Aeromicrobium stalagmiti TaxID=2738988 RepID=UPI00156838E9|nr:VTT domain-containing protein [Aeromicrobium stalagmiti]NRQ49609.1 VTT domain-containing protein [Aeromicrobium stalagmiti]